MKAELKFRFEENLARVNNLVDIYENKLSTAGQGRRPTASADILRAAVVFLHATVEEYLRGILEWQLPEQNEEILNSVPLIGTDTARPEKFLLGRLANHRNKNVQELIRESVSASLARSNFNSVEEIVSVLKSVNLNKVPCEPTFKYIQQLMERRHQIVHRADRNPQPGQGHHHANSIGLHNVRGWIFQAQQFFEAIHAQLPD